MAFYHGLKNYDVPEAWQSDSDWVAERLLTLRSFLYDEIRRDRAPNSLIIGSWNLVAFDGGLPRLDESYHYIAEIIDHFDICAIQEIKSDLKPLKRLVGLLGPNWDFFVGDVSRGDSGNSERMAFVFNKNRVFFRNLIGELVLSREELIDGQPLARSPYLASFQAGWFRFTLCSAHITFGAQDRRAREIEAIGKVLVSEAKKDDQVYVLLGDLNTETGEDIVEAALANTKMQKPDFGPTNLNGKNAFDHIAFTTKGSKNTLKTKMLRSGSFDWRYALYGALYDVHPPKPLPADAHPAARLRSDAEYHAHYAPIFAAQRIRHKEKPYKDFAKSYRTFTRNEMSDHLPVWVELQVDYSNEYLERFLDD